MKKVPFLLVCAMWLLMNGCASQQREQSTDPVCFPNTLPTQAMGAAQTVLSRMHFKIEKFDTEAGYVRTYPLTGAQFFEFWRKDNASAYAAAESNLHSIRRTVELTVTPEGTTTCVQCMVQVDSLSVPEAPIVGFRQMGGMHTKSVTSFQTLRIDSDRKATSEWLDVGPDPDLEQRIIKYIQQELDKETVQ